MKIKHYKAGDRIIKQGGKGTHVFFILDGSCSVILEKNKMQYNLNNLTVGRYFWGNSCFYR
jgi:CRP-like cAMP-binding protein